MKRTIGLFLAPLVIFAFATTSFPQATPETGATPGSAEKKAETKAPGKQWVKPSRFEGKVVVVDREAGTLLVKGKDGTERSFTVETQSAKARLARARVGQAIRLTYREKDGKFVANSLAGGLGGKEQPKGK